MLRRLLPEIWYGDRPAPMVLRGLSRLYAGWARRRLARPTEKPPVPVIVVGNLTAGGTGKTPLVIHLVGLLRKHGYRPAVISRGYGGREPARPRRVETGDGAGVVGDEPLLLHNTAKCPVWVCRHRRRALDAAVEAGADVVISDDGLQHRALPRSLELCVIDGDRRFGNGRVLPAGPLRQPLERLDQVDAVVCKESPGGAGHHVGEIPMRLCPEALVSLADGSRIPPSALPVRKISAVAGIGHPEGFFRTLEALGFGVAGHPLADHARIDTELLAKLDGPIIVTAKDAARLGAGVTDPRIWVLEVDAELPDVFDQWLLQRTGEAS